MAQKSRKTRKRPDKLAKAHIPGFADNRLTFDYIKSNYFRVTSINGVIGGLTPSGDIHMAVWSQRQPYPRQVVHEATAQEDGSIHIGAEIDREMRPAIIREIEAGLVFNESLARAMVTWLEKRLEELSSLGKTSEVHDGEDDARSDSEPTTDSERDDIAKSED